MKIETTNKIIKNKNGETVTIANAIKCENSKYVVALSEAGMTAVCLNWYKFPTVEQWVSAGGFDDDYSELVRLIDRMHAYSVAIRNLSERSMQGNDRAELLKKNQRRLRETMSTFCELLGSRYDAEGNMKKSVLAIDTNALPAIYMCLASKARMSKTGKTSAGFAKFVVPYLVYLMQGKLTSAKELALEENKNKVEAKPEKAETETAKSEKAEAADAKVLEGKLRASAEMVKMLEEELKVKAERIAYLEKLLADNGIKFD